MKRHSENVPLVRSLFRSAALVARSHAPSRSSRSLRSLTHRHRVLYVHQKPSLMGSISSRKCSPISESLFREFASRKTDLAKAKERATGAKWSERSEVECGGVCQRATSAAERTSCAVSDKSNPLCPLIHHNYLIFTL